MVYRYINVRADVMGMFGCCHNLMTKFNNSGAVIAC